MAIILVLDEEHDSRTLLKRALERGGHEVLAFSNPEGIGERVSEKELDLIILSARPGERGAGSFRDGLKKLPPGVAVITIADYESGSETEWIAGEHFLSRPVDLETIESRVRMVLGNGLATEKNGS